MRRRATSPRNSLGKSVMNGVALGSGLHIALAIP